MTLPLERARSRRPITWLTLIGVLLLPVVIGGILVTALYNPIERLDALRVAVVNDDAPVTIDGQMVPLGRQLTAGLVEGSDDIPSNLTWTISNDDDAEAGLADGTYNAVVTIPENFSAAATSTAPGGTPEQATIAVSTSPDSLIVDDAITAQVTSAAAALLGQQLSQVYLENVFLGFTTLGDQLGQAADGAGQWADGAHTAADGAVSLSDGIAQLSSGATQLSSGANGIATGASSLAGGTAQLANGATSAADGLNSWAAGAGQLASGTSDLAGGLGLIAGQVAQIPAVPQEIVDGVDQIAANSEQIKQSATDAAAQLAALSATCLADGGTAQLCDAVADASARANAALPTITSVIDQSGTVATQVRALSQFGPQLTAALQSSAAGAQQLSEGMNGLASGAVDAAAGVRSLAGGMSQTAAGAGQLSTGAAQLAGGADTLATGADTAADGAADLGDGVAQLADGADTIADGLATASASLPSYTDAEATDLAGIVADPVAATGLGTNLFGASAIPLLAMLALWFGGLGSFIALRAVSAHALTSRRPSALLALRSLAPAVGIGAAQGLLVAGVVQIAGSYDWADWSVFAALCMVAGVAFAAVNQALVAVFGGAGRWISALIGVLAVATGIVSTAPGVLAQFAGLLPTASAYHAMLAALTSAGGIGSAVVGLLVWAVLAFVATTLAVARRRTISARAVLVASPA